MIADVVRYFNDLQDRLCAALEVQDGQARFSTDRWEHRAGGGGIPRALADGQVFERAGVNFSHIVGEQLPAAASVGRTHISGRAFAATGVSVVIHPHNPHVPTAHLNVRFFTTRDPEPCWWFGGGFDLTPYYGYEEDAVHWHRTAKAACDPHGVNLYARFKKQCDDYFFLRHRNEARGIGGLFFDDFVDGGFAQAFALTKSVGDHFLPAYLPLVAKRKDVPFGAREREFQLYRRGRYVEFNLLYDRGTLFGLQSGGRVEAILTSLPPLVAWRYDWQAEPDSPEAQLTEYFLKPRDWV